MDKHCSESSDGIDRPLQAADGVQRSHAGRAADRRLQLPQGRLEEAQDPDDSNPKSRTIYTDSYPVDRLEKIVKASLARLEMKVATETMKQKFLQSLGTLRRKTSENVRYTPIPTRFYELSTRQRQTDSVSSAELRRDKCTYVTDQTRASLKDEQVEFFDEVAEPGSGYKSISIAISARARRFAASAAACCFALSAAMSALDLIVKSAGGSAFVFACASI